MAVNEKVMMKTVNVRCVLLFLICFNRRGKNKSVKIKV